MFKKAKKEKQIQSIIQEQLVILNFPHNQTCRFTSEPIHGGNGEATKKRKKKKKKTKSLEHVDATGTCDHSIRDLWGM